jgi:hypothetical protein
VTIVRTAMSDEVAIEDLDTQTCQKVES